jgi:hypothetical protein
MFRVVGTEPNHTVRLIPPSSASVVVPISEAIEGLIASVGADRLAGGGIAPPVFDEGLNDLVIHQIRKVAPRVNAEVLF